MPPPVISAIKLRKTYVTTPAVDCVSFEVQPGESVALLGENGSGKTTVLSLVLGLLAPDPPPDGGEVRTLGCANVASDSSAKQRVALIADYAGPVPWANSAEIAYLYAELYKHWDMAEWERLTARWSVPRHSALNALSKGQRRLAEVALAVAARPDLVVLDEPYNGLDPVMRHEIQTLLRELHRERGLTILYSTHILTEVDKLADRVLVLKHGKLVLDSPVADLDGGVEAAFLRHHDLLAGEEARQ
jgi:ABC-2 type transport system ATP-binding protein